jgi:hypothetical protein
VLPVAGTRALALVTPGMLRTAPPATGLVGKIAARAEREWKSFEGASPGGFL